MIDYFRMDFNSLEWHDAIITNIELDRRNPGMNDTVVFDITWPNEQKSPLIFEDVYSVKMTLNFGIVAPETILSAVAEDECPDLEDFYSKWKGLMDNVRLMCYTIMTNSTGGKIKILAKGFRVSK